MDLWEAKRRYDATFVNRFQAVPGGTRYTLTADVRLKGAARLLAPLLRGLIRRRMRRYVLEPVRIAAEARDADPRMLTEREGHAQRAR